MRKYANMIGCVAASMSLLLLGAPGAQADDASFVRDAHALGFVTNTDNLISMGRSACYFLYEGERFSSDPLRNNPPDRVAARIMRYGNVDLNAANRFLAMSVAEYCPQLGYRLNE
jgi:hypothetical protein